MNDPVAERYAQLAGFADQIAARLIEQIEALGFAQGAVRFHPPGDAVFRLEKDPSNGRYSLVGEWRDERGLKFGELLFHSDGSFFVEQDIALPHPGRPKWFVEAVNAWGREGQIKAEPRLLPMPD